jgi:anthranilate phosphoribosyltransferase
MAERRNTILHHYLAEFGEGRHLSAADLELFFDALLCETDETLLSELLIKWETKGTSEDEIFGLAALMRSRMKRIRSGADVVVDIVGTGGSRAKTFNVSTAAAFVIAGAGLTVAKHGNRAATSNSGSTDVLEMLGVKADITSEQTEQCLRELGICFMFAPKFHSLSPTLGTVRRRLGRPTIFNNLGPLCNPAGATHQIIGVSNRDHIDLTARVLARLGTKGSWVVHGDNGLDEIALGHTHVAKIGGENIISTVITPANFGKEITKGEAPEARLAVESAALIRRILENKMNGDNAETLVLINAAAAIHVAGKAADLCDGFAMARESVRSGSALARVNSLVEATN